VNTVNLVRVIKNMLNFVAETLLQSLIINTKVPSVNRTMTRIHTS